MITVIYYEIENSGIYERRHSNRFKASLELIRLKQVLGLKMINYRIVTEK